ncbi:MAG: sigma 54-interacting transcriptional regulator, partial [Thermodesulfobacteriota bacterium]
MTAPDTRPNPADKPRILIVDDDAASVHTLMTFLHQAGFETRIAPDGHRALRLIRSAPPDLILLDILMPEMDGFAICRRLKSGEMADGIPVIFMTALSDTDSKISGFQAGGVDFVTKPVQHEEVLARVRTHLTLRRLHQDLQMEKDRFQRLSRATWEGIVLHTGGRIADVNAAAVRMFGWSANHLIGGDLRNLLSPHAKSRFEAALEDEDEQPWEAVGVRSDGTPFPLEIQMRPLPGPDGGVTVAALRDITRRRTLEEAQARLSRENITLRAGVDDRYRFGEIIGRSPAMQAVYRSIARAAATDAGVIVSGESGTGKELAARTIHRLSRRRERPFVAVNCAAIPESLFEREFFGHCRGAFTDAVRDTPGFLARADGGTLLLDEVTELSHAGQAKLLRVLQEREFYPLGAAQPRRLDIRIIAATNRDLTAQMREGRIRKDFYYRIRVIHIHLPPLRERREDIPLLTEHLLQQDTCDPAGAALPVRLMETLCTYHWPGNVRELQNELERWKAGQPVE